MDFQRTLLIGAAAMLSFMLLTEWVAFKDARSSASAESTTRLTATPTPASVSDQTTGQAAIPEAPASESGSEPANGDVPEIPSEPQAATIPQASDSGSGRIIQVKTDVLHLAIDLLGGDIVEAALPAYPATVDTPDVPFVLLERNDRRSYIAQSGLIGADGIDSAGRALYRSAQTSYTLDPGEQELKVDLSWTNDQGVTVTKRFTLRPGDYLVDVDFLVSNQSERRWQASMFGQIKRDSTGDPSADTSGMGMAPFLGSAITLPDKRFSKFDFDDMKEEPFKGQIEGGWVAMIQHYFLSAWIPNPAQTHTFTTRVTRDNFNIAGFISPALVVDPGNSSVTGASFFAGPKDQPRLREISPYLELTVDYGWLWWIAQPLFWLLTKMYALSGNWGVAIILLTVLIKAAFFQLSATSYKSMARMRAVQPKMQAIREEFADDKQKQSHAMMELYKKEKINPMGGCLPILVQMPVFIALYWVLMESVELRQAPFMLWIEDLSLMDPYFVLPLMMGASMWFMQKLNPPPPDPMQAKVMQWLPVMFTFFFLWFPAGLVLYWVVNNLLSMAQQYVITRRIEKAAAAN